MKFCTNCGQELDENQEVCLNCGVVVKQTTFRDDSASTEDTGSFGWGLLGFCIPLAGLIVFLIWNKDRPMSAKKAGIGAIIGVIVNIILSAVLIGSSAALAGLY